MKRLDSNPARRVSIDFEGDRLDAQEGEPAACALLASGERIFSRSVKYHRPRGPFCMAASCSHCLMRVDGVPNVFTCQVPVHAGMRLERQNAYPSAEVDVFRSIDWLFPRGLDHHAMFAGVPVAEQVMQKVARHLAGLGLLPDRPAPDRAPAEILRKPVAIVGAGPAGLEAARALTAARIDFLLLERSPFLGGRLAGAASEPGAPAIPDPGAFPEGSLRLSTPAIGCFEGEGGRFLVAVSMRPAPRLVLVFPQRFLFAGGGTARMLPFPNNDLPGVFSARAAAELIRRHRLLPGEEVACVGYGDELRATAQLLTAAGAEVPLVLDLAHAEVVRAHGRNGVRGLSYRENGRTRRVRCDALAIAVPPAPSFELARHAGAEVAFDPALGAFKVTCDADGRTAQEAVFVAGEAAGHVALSAIVESGARAARAIQEGLL